MIWTTLFFGDGGSDEGCNVLGQLEVNILSMKTVSTNTSFQMMASGAYTKAITDAFIDYWFITMIELKAKGILEMIFFRWSQRIIKELGLIDVFGEFLALQPFCYALNLFRERFESAFGRRNRWYSFETVRPVIDLASCDPMSALTISVMAGEC